MWFSNKGNQRKKKVLQTAEEQMIGVYMIYASVVPLVRHSI